MAPSISSPALLVGGLVGWFIIRPVNGVLGWFFRGFNRLLRPDDRRLRQDGRQIAAAERRSCLLIYGGLLGADLLAIPCGARPASSPSRTRAT